MDLRSVGEAPPSVCVLDACAGSIKGRAKGHSEEGKGWHGGLGSLWTSLGRLSVLCVPLRLNAWATVRGRRLPHLCE